MSERVEWGKLSERERDAVVAEMLMGWTRVGLRRLGNQKHRGEDMNGYPPGKGSVAGHLSFVPHYTTDIAAAWEVVEKLFAAGFYVAVSKPASALTWDVRGWKDDNSARFIAHAPTAPEAICIAALRASGLDIVLPGEPTPSKEPTNG